MCMHQHLKENMGKDLKTQGQTKFGDSDAQPGMITSCYWAIFLKTLSYNEQLINQKPGG